LDHRFQAWDSRTEACFEGRSTEIEDRLLETVDRYFWWKAAMKKLKHRHLLAAHSKRLAELEHGAIRVMLNMRRNAIRGPRDTPI
jgi:hypothetical protein